MLPIRDSCTMSTSFLAKAMTDTISSTALLDWSVKAAYESSWGLTQMLHSADLQSSPPSGEQFPPLRSLT